MKRFFPAYCFTGLYRQNKHFKIIQTGGWNGFRCTVYSKSQRFNLKNVL
jgi:hypothetical protein